MGPCMFPFVRELKPFKRLFVGMQSSEKEKEKVMAGDCDSDVNLGQEVGVSIQGNISHPLAGQVAAVHHELYRPPARH